MSCRCGRYAFDRAVSGTLWGFTMPISRINGADIYWEMEGDHGDPIVLVHGSWVDHENWAPVVPDLAQSLRVLTYDRRGHSRSERPPGQGSVREDVADLAALLEELEHAPAHVVGNSFGGSIVLRTAIERPDLYRSLIVHEPPLFGLLNDEPDAQQALSAVNERIEAVRAILNGGDMTEGARRFVETIAYGPGSWPQLIEEVRNKFIFNAPTWLDELRDPEVMEIDLNRLSRFSAPALVTLGDRSPPFFALVVDKIAAAIPRAIRGTYRDAGHVPYSTNPADYVRVVREFVENSTVRRSERFACD